MEETLSQLEALGLGKTEAKLYVAGLAYAHAVGVNELQKRTGLKRPTIYHNLDLLAARGLVAKVSSLNRTLYTFSSPDQLERAVEAEVREAKTKLRTLAQLLKQLESVQPAANQTIVRHFEGIQGIKTVVDMALFCQEPLWRVIAPMDNFFREFDERYAQYYLVTRKRHGIKSKTLWERPDPGGRQLTRQEISERQPRYLPEVMQRRFTATTILFDNKIAIVTSLNEQSAILIESAELSSLFVALFEGLWAGSTPYIAAPEKAAKPSSVSR
ncbi:MAG TPA: helix-turn-helix domain-containing protein [Verrucomicrobiae bacterium]|jgi:sugar-specific transcriptional regulator TrmB|nr:helix-turn-helix domain-containing protein [Verrucomicrobiae bacterium]